MIINKNKHIAEMLRKNNLVSNEALKVCQMEADLLEEDLSKVLVRNNFISQNQLMNLIIDLDEETLTTEYTIVPNIKPEILIENKTIINAVTDKKVFFSTMNKNGSDIAYLLKTNYFPKHELIEIPCNPEIVIEYLEKIESIYFDEGSAVERIIRKAIKEQVSDIHIVPHRDTYTILYRYLGVRHPESMGMKDEFNQICARIKDLSKMDMSERRKPQDGGFQLDYNGKAVDLRVSTVPTAHGEIIVIRILDPEKAQLDLNKLGISNITEWRKGASRSDGLCLICGPTGSGKTTTLNSTLREQDRFGKAIFTIEDPVEYRIPYIGQVDINPNVGLDFARAIKSFMRSDPDIIVVGEVRDQETARNAIKAAETGHLVFATLHTGSIQGAVNRLRDLGVEGHELKYVLRSVMAQRLMRVVCKTCNGKGHIGEDAENECKTCSGNGYSGRTIVSEIKYFSELNEVVNLISGKEQEVNITWETMLENAYSKFKSGISSPGELIRSFGAEGEKLLLKDGYDITKITKEGFFEENYLLEKEKEDENGNI